MATTETTTIDEDAVREAGWIKVSEADLHASDCTREHCDVNYCGLNEAAMRAELERWHDEAGHRHALRFCDERPCKDLTRAGD